MIPTRLQILTKLVELKQQALSESQVYDGLNEWLIAQDCPDTDRQKILADIYSY